MGTRFLIALLVLSGCMKESKLYCQMHGDEDPAVCGYRDAAIDARPTCTTSADCSAPTKFCETTTHYCVECLGSSDCPTSAKPLCDPTTFTCEGCVTNEDCASKACLPTGICGDDTNVAYVDPAANATTGCTFLAPCGKIVDALKLGRPYLKLTGTISEAVTIMSTVLTILADPGTVLTRPNGGVVVAIAGGSDVTIYDVRIVGNGDKGIASGASTLRLYRVSVTGCDKVALEIKGGTIIASRCQVYGNPGGGFSTDAMADFNLTNNIIVHNGIDSGAIGGAVLSASSSGQNRFELNTVADNRAKLGVPGGVYCSPLGLTAPNNLFARNYTSTSATVLGANTGGGCSFGNSLSATDVAAFKFVMPEGTGPWDYHVQSGSSAIDSAGATDISFDIDGNIRPQGTGIDFGADEYRP